MVLVPSLAEMLAQRCKTLAVVSSGTTGSAFGKPARPKGIGILVNAFWEPGRRVAFPDAANDAILRRFPPVPQKAATLDPSNEEVSWTQRVLRDYVLAELRPDVVVNWLTEPDHLQHAIGAGSPQARAAIRNDDSEVGLLLDRLRELGLADKTNVIVVSDHSFGHGTFGVDVALSQPISSRILPAGSARVASIHIGEIVSSPTGLRSSSTL
jgi:arylsulfatase A-like enzyme